MVISSSPYRHGLTALVFHLISEASRGEHVDEVAFLLAIVSLQLGIVASRLGLVIGFKKVVFLLLLLLRDWSSAVESGQIVASSSLKFGLLLVGDSLHARHSSSVELGLVRLSEA